MGRYDKLCGDEPEIAARRREKQDAYEEFHADDFKFTEAWLNENNEN